MSESVLPSVLATGQLQSRVQRQGRYVAESMRHPGKMLPSIASQIISAFTEPGDLVVDPMCGIGTTLVEAVHLGRHVAGMEYEADFAALTAANVQHARSQGAAGFARVACGDARNIATVLGDLQGMAALVLTSPPYGMRTHGHVQCGSREGGGPVKKSNHRYSTNKGNLAHQRLPQLMEGFGQILAGCRELLQPGGVVAITIRPIRVDGQLVDLPGQVIETAEAAGLVLTHRLAALLCGLRDGRLINRASFFQMLEAWRSQEKGQPVCAAAHEDLLILRIPKPSPRSR
ncbi:TRM11 family SAM-dependent methyltransferase [Nonomuraea jiangxiensis]|uniref:Methyltransferase n=1 Tax=Nonomuraea jiangxiensis TaxID=633440 RepID=A0A1G9LRW4_9ACTN|nr:DNA methyltransferase [Nonomuraea jiangxiensis]SDL64215.1 DNA methylase [Nonomuraea jiangxiensis]